LLAEPFLLLSEIENSIRDLIANRFEKTEIAKALRDESNSDIYLESSDLTFGDYIRLMENPTRWGKLQLNIDRAIFCKDLDRIRRIRNDVMHFDPDGISLEDIDALRDFTEFLKTIRSITANH